MKQFSLAIQGGGIRGSYAAGVVDVLMEHELFAKSTYGTSAGALIGVNYVSHQKGRTIEIMTKGMTDPQFASFKLFLKTGSFFNFDFMFHGITEKIPFDENNFFNNEMEFHACSTNCLSGEAIYWGKNTKEFYSALASSCSLPMYVRKPVMVEGVPCLDGGMVERVPFYALLNRPEKLIVVTTREKGFRYNGNKKFELEICKERFKKYPNLINAISKEHEVYNRQMDELSRLEKEGKAFVIYPSSPLKISLTEHREKKIMAVYLQGKKDMEDNLSKFNKFTE